MTDDELENRLHRMLAGRADQVQSSLSGPDLRAREVRREHRAARIAGPILAAAAVLIIAIAPQALNGHGGHQLRPQQPGNSETSVPKTPTPTHTPTRNPLPTIVPS